MVNQIQRKPENGKRYQVMNLLHQWVDATYKETESGDFAQWEIEGGGFLYVWDVTEWRDSDK